jgi:CcmD family protein
MCGRAALKFTAFMKRRKEGRVLDFFSQNALYVVLLVTLAVWLGIYVYLLRIERKLKRLEDQNGQK